VPPDTFTFKLSQPNVFKRESEKEFFVLHHKAPVNALKIWSEREKAMAEES